MFWGAQDRVDPVRTTVGYAGVNTVVLLPGFSCPRKQFVPQNQALEEENEHQIIFSKELEQKKNPTPISPSHPHARTPWVWLPLKGGKRRGWGEESCL